nr:DUF2306 domain-containing protein [uncultured Dyadobacter sp.]
MIEHTAPARATGSQSSLRMLEVAATVWLAVTTAGQWLFGGYIIGFYGRSTAAGNYARWNEVLPHGYVAGDWKGNLVVGMHVLLAAILVIGGPIQLMPRLRSRFPRFHRWLGRIYAATAVIVASGGLVMVWTRGAVGDQVQHISISIQAIYIIGFAVIAVKYAWARRFDQHRKWALRLFMVVSGVWFFRIGLMGWLVLHGGPVGFDPKTFCGPFLTVLALLAYALPLPLAILEFYFYAQKTRKRPVVIAASLVILTAALLMAVGIAGAAMGMWLPRIR